MISVIISIVDVVIVVVTVVIDIVVVVVELAAPRRHKINHKSHDLLRVGLNNFQFFFSSCSSPPSANHVIC